MQVVQHPEATAELIEAGRFYEQKVPSLGAQFLDAIDEAVAAISAGPERWHIIESDIRRYLLPRFPYAVYDRVLTDHIRILAFKHHSRRPDYWRTRLTK
jgi:plasmid stabilization system protein ParE